MTARLADAALVLVAADALGGGQKVTDMSVAYAKEREQFGQPDETQAALLAQLAKTALANGVSPLALRYLRLPSGEDLRNRFLAQGGGGSFLEYFKSQYPMLAGL